MINFLDVTIGKHVCQYFGGLVRITKTCILTIVAKNRIISFKYAVEGIWLALKEEPNLLFHLLAGLIVVILGTILNITTVEWLILILTIGLVISLELTNTAIEELVDSFTEDEHPAAKKAKDVAAGAVLIASITAIIIGLLIFLPYFI